MSTRMITSKEQRRIFGNCLSNREARDIVFFYHHSIHDYRCADKQEWTDEMISFRKLRKKGILQCLELNNKTHTFGDNNYSKTLYFLVIQDTNEDNNPHIDPMGFAVKDHTFVIRGMIYAFLSETNRDKSYKYIMGIK